MPGIKCECISAFNTEKSETSFATFFFLKKLISFSFQAIRNTRKTYLLPNDDNCISAEQNWPLYCLNFFSVHHPEQVAKGFFEMILHHSQEIIMRTLLLSLY